MRSWLFLFLTLVLAAPAGAGTMAGVTMPDSATVDDEILLLNGMALRKKMVFKVYVAGLYLPEKTTDADALLDSDTTRMIVMHWKRGVGTDKICGGWQDGLKKNTPDASADLKADFDTLCVWTVDSEEGQEFVLTYVPGKGTEIDVAGTIKGVIPGKEFADALFACFIGPDPGPGKKFKKKLMGVD